MTDLANLPYGTYATIHSIQGELTVPLMELGLVPGTRVRVLRCAPLGDPLQVEVFGAQLAIRRAVAATVTVEL